MQKNDCLTRLIASDPFQSFVSEQRVHQIFKKLQWDSVHGGYHQDLETGKHREIDVLARQIWTRKTKSGDQLARLTAAIEVKSMKGFHLLFSPVEKEFMWCPRHDVWLGHLKNRNQRLGDALISSGFADAEIRKLLTDFQKFAYPREHARMSSMMIDPPVELIASAFRETNIGGEKDLESSVFWKANQSLHSAIRSLQEDVTRYHFAWITDSIECAKERGEDGVSEAFRWLCRQVQMADMFHPILVTDALLWKVQGEEAEQIKWCRFAQLTYNGIASWWCDVVNSAHIVEYAEKITGHYRQTLRRLKSRRC